MKNRRRFVLFTAAAALLFVLALPGVHWRLYGWWRGEAFYRGRPSSYWRSEIAACDTWLQYPHSMVGITRHMYGLPPPAPEMCLFPRLSPIDRFRLWLAKNLGRPELAVDSVAAIVECDASAVPVLIALLDDRDPKVRYFAAQTLGFLKSDAREALPALRDLASDHTAVSGSGDETVGHAAAQAVEWITSPAPPWSR